MTNHEETTTVKSNPEFDEVTRRFLAKYKSIQKLVRRIFKYSAVETAIHQFKGKHFSGCNVFHGRKPSCHYGINGYSEDDGVVTFSVGVTYYFDLYSVPNTELENELYCRNAGDIIVRPEKLHKQDRVSATLHKFVAYGHVFLDFNVATGTVTVSPETHPSVNHVALLQPQVIRVPSAANN